MHREADYLRIMSNFATKIVKWYTQHKRVLPWRFQETEGVNLYKTWLSEIMLQQTTVPTVINYYQAFLVKWPTVHHLATATEEEVLTAWQGLGYYSRARNLLKCARMVVAEFNGRFPTTEAQLLKLPGIGPYTAAAILAIGNNTKATAVDGNVERIMARVHAINDPIQTAKKRLKELAKSHVPHHHVSEYTQGLMDLGTMVCTPQNPKCDVCPVVAHCQAQKEGIENQLPIRLTKAALPEKFTISYLSLQDDHILVRRRTEGNLLKNMIELPSVPWGTDPVAYNVSHTFSHFHIRIQCEQTATIPAEAINGEEFWHPLDKLHELPLPTMTKKVLKFGKIHL